MTSIDPASTFEQKRSMPVEFSAKMPKNWDIPWKLYRYHSWDNIAGTPVSRVYSFPRLYSPSLVTQPDLRARLETEV